MDIITAFTELKAKAASSKDDLRTINVIEIGQYARQGDIYIVAVDPSHKKGEPFGTNKLAEGSSKGSSHFVVGNCEVFKGSQPDGYNYSNISNLVGPVLVAHDRVVIEHPEHADISIPAGTYQIMYQLDTRTMNKVID